MWKSLKEDEMPIVPQSPKSAAAPVPQPQAEAPKSGPQSQPAYTTAAEITRIGKSVSLRGEVTGREDLFMDGELDGSIDLSGRLLTIGLNSHIRANIQAQSVVILGRVEGNVRASERVELRKSAVVNGDILTPRVMIEEGAFLKGSVDIRKPGQKPEVRRATAAPISATAGNLESQIPLPNQEPATIPSPTTDTSAGSQGSLTDQYLFTEHK